MPGIPVSFAGSLIGLTTVGNYVEVLRLNLTPSLIDLTTNLHNTGTKNKRRTLIPVYTGASTTTSDATKTPSKKSTNMSTTNQSTNSVSTISYTTDNIDTLFKKKISTWPQLTIWSLTWAKRATFYEGTE